MLLLLIRKDEEAAQFFSTVRPEEIPEIPTNKFLFRGSPPKKVEADRYVCVFHSHLVVVVMVVVILRICTKTRDGDRPSQEWRRASGRPPTTWIHQVCRDTGVTATEALQLSEDRPFW